MEQAPVLNYDDETSELVEFYESRLDFFETCPVYNLTPGVLKTLAVMLHAKFYFESDWQGCASEMGVTDNLHLATIQESAKVTKELPLYITMKNTLQHMNGNVANIIKAFLNTKRYDALLFLKPFVEKLLEKIPNTEVKVSVNDEEGPPYQRNKNFHLSCEMSDEVICETVTSMYSIYTEEGEKPLASELDPILIAKHPELESSALSKNSDSRNPKSELQLHSSSNMSKHSYEYSSLENTKVPSAPPEESVSVLIQHTERDTEVAKQLSIKLKDEGFSVATLFDMEMIIRADPSRVLSKVFQEVDFIIPIVSEEFLQQIDPQVCDDYDAMCNRSLYQLITNEYQYNGCVNFRVRPVLVPDMKRCPKLTNNVILCYSFRLWSESEKLIRILKETKEVIKFHLLKMKGKAR